MNFEFLIGFVYYLYECWDGSEYVFFMVSLEEWGFNLFYCFVVMVELLVDYIWDVLCKVFEMEEDEV